MQFNEGLKAGDLEGVISNRFSIDQYKSKMGDDKNILVLAFEADSLAPAKDLERFAETGYKFILDADATPGTMKDGKHRVFVEFARQEGVINNIISFLEDLKKLTNIEEFEYTYHKGQNPTMVSSGSLQEVVPSTPDAYEQRVNEIKIGEAKNFFDKFNMMEVKMHSNIIEVKKQGAGALKFELHAFGDTKSVINETKAFKIDGSAMSECMWLTKYFGTYDITKTYEDKFIFSKDGQSALVSKHQW